MSGQAVDRSDRPNDVNPYVFHFASLASVGVTHGVTSRCPEMADEGDFSFFTATKKVNALRNRAIWTEAIGVSSDQLVLGRQVHGNTVQIVDKRDAGRGACGVENAIQGVDGLITATPHLPLAVMCADCVPILLHDPVKGVVAVVHAGWRGTVAGIAGQTVQTMRKHFGSSPGDLIAGLGPSIGPCCYNVGPEVIDAWEQYGIDPNSNAVSKHDDQLWFDLWAANVRTLESAGLQPDRIEQSDICTRCQADRYFSRRAGRPHRGLFASIIALT